MSTYDIKGGKFERSHLGDVEQQVNTDQSMTIERGASVGTASQSAAPTLTAEARSAAIDAQLATLRAAVDELARRLPAKEAQQVKEDLEQLEKQAKSETPRQRWYDVSAEGLVSAAKAVGELVEPVSTAVLAIGKLVFGM